MTPSALWQAHTQTSSCMWPPEDDIRCLPSAWGQNSMHARDARSHHDQATQHRDSFVILSLSDQSGFWSPGRVCPCACSFKDSNICDKPRARRRAVTRKLVAKTRSPKAHAPKARSFVRVTVFRNRLLVNKFFFRGFQLLQTDPRQITVTGAARGREYWESSFGSNLFQLFSNF
jgi:hypothetical protein